MDRDFPNIINKDGIAVYYGCILNAETLPTIYTNLFNKIAWLQDQIVMFGKPITTKRKVAFYADNHIDYTYSSVKKKSLPWTPELLQIKNLVESHTGAIYNACLLNLYHTGEEGMGWHSDDEPEMDRSIIASVTFGGKRTFHFRHKRSAEKLSIELQDRSLLLMIHMQDDWQHSIPKTRRAVAPRINLTFRRIQPIETK